MLRVLNEAFDNPLEAEELAASPFAGGITQYGYQCGQLWGAALAAGARAHTVYGPGPKGETAAMVTAQRLVALFRDRYKEINCLEMIDCDWNDAKSRRRFYLRGGPVKCFTMAAGFAKRSLREIVATLDDETSWSGSEVNEANAETRQVSCAAEVARRLGLSDRQITMVAGLAGGIGFAGGACGALAVAIFALALEGVRKGGAKYLWESKDFKAEIQGLIDRFLKASDHSMECRDIVKREFSSISDHAEHIRGGGCAKIIEILAS